MPEEPALPNHTRVAITICVILATLMQALDTTIANVALPYMQGSVSASADQINWVLTSYIVAAAIMTPPSGFLANRFGRKRVLMVAVSGFVLASVLCGIAQSLLEIVAFRLLQGFFGAALVPIAQSILLDIYTPEERGSAIALFGVSVMSGILIINGYYRVAATGVPTIEAMFRAAEEQMRPILMMTLSASIGLLPAAISTGIGSQVQRPLATVIVGGMLIGPIWLLLVVPALQSFFLRHEQPEPVPEENADAELPI